MHGFDLIATIAGGFTAALILGYITQRIGLSPLVGYLLAGVLVGPAHAGLCRRRRAGRTAGRDWRHPPDVRRRAAVPLRRAAGRARRRRARRDRAKRRRDAAGRGRRARPSAGRGPPPSSSGSRCRWPARWCSSACSPTTATCTRPPATSPSAGSSSRTCSPSSCWCCCRRCLAPRRRRGPTLALSLGLTALKVAGLVAFTVVVGTRVIPWLLDRVAETRSRELFTLTVLALALGIALGAATVFGVSMALGAFLAGMVVGRSEYSLRAASEALPMRDAFAVLFFVSVGMLLDPALPARGAAAGGGHAGGGGRGQAAGGDGRRAAAAVSGPRGLRRGGRAGADWRVLVHPGRAGPRAGRAAARGDEHDRRRRDRLHRAQPAALPRAAGASSDGRPGSPRLWRLLNALARRPAGPTAPSPDDAGAACRRTARSSSATARRDAP